MNRNVRRKILIALAVTLVFVGALFVIWFGVLHNRQEIPSDNVIINTSSSLQIAASSTVKMPVVKIVDSAVVMQNSEWRLDSSVFSSRKDKVIYSAFDAVKKVYGIFLFTTTDGSSILLRKFSLSNSQINFSAADFQSPSAYIPSSPDLAPLLPLSTIKFSPDETKFWFQTQAGVGLPDSSFILDVQGNNYIPVNLPEGVDQSYWFSNTEIAFGGATYGGAPYDFPSIQIYNIHTKKIAPTRIPTRTDFGRLEPKINPAATAYASYDVVNNSALYCGQNLEQLIIRSYPDGAELYRLENVHEVSYRWLNSGELEIHYTRAPGIYNTTTQQGFATSSEQVVCINEKMIYKLPKK